MGAFGYENWQDDFASLGVQQLIDAPAPEAFTSITRLAMRLFHVPVALISVVQEEFDRQYFVSQVGLPEPWKSYRQTPLTHSFCQHVKRKNRPLVVTNSRNHPLVRNNLAITDLGVVAYLGMPILLPDGSPLGALCLIDSSPREWTDEDQENLRDLANCVNDEILLRAAMLKNEQLQEKSQRYNAMRESIVQVFMAPDLSIEERFCALLRTSCRSLGMEYGRITKISGGSTVTLFEASCAKPKDQSYDWTRVSDLLDLVTSECRNTYIDDLGTNAEKCSQIGEENGRGRYAGSPLVINGVLYGAIELVNARPNTAPWSEEELSILSIVSMFVTAHLGLLRQISTLQNSEMALLMSISQTKNQISSTMEERIS